MYLFNRPESQKKQKDNNYFLNAAIIFKNEAAKKNSRLLHSLWFGVDERTHQGAHVFSDGSGGLRNLKDMSKRCFDKK
jgi:hypothetical protein